MCSSITCLTCFIQHDNMTFSKTGLNIRCWVSESSNCSFILDMCFHSSSKAHVTYLAVCVQVCVFSRDMLCVGGCSCRQTGSLRCVSGLMAKWMQWAGERGVCGGSLSAWHRWMGPHMGRRTGTFSSQTLPLWMWLFDGVLCVCLSGNSMGSSAAIVGNRFVCVCVSSDLDTTVLWNSLLLSLISKDSLQLSLPFSEH